jgi:hypothetical protein
MYELSAYAIQNGALMEVTITGYLPDSCHRAIVADIFPGGNVMYIKHPREAQVFINEWASNDGIMCAMALVPWSATVTILSSDLPISIYINHQRVATINAATENDQFCVWELAVGFIPPHGTYSILPESVELPPRIWTKYFGPANYKACSEWVLEHGSLAAISNVLAGGGSGSPRGLSEPRFVF